MDRGICLKIFIQTMLHFLGSLNLIMGKWIRFLSQKRSGGGKGVKEKRSNVSNIEVVMDGAVPSVTGDSENAAMEVESPSVVEETVEKEKLSPMVNTSDLGSYPPLPTLETTSAGNALGGNGIDVVVRVESIRATSKRFVNTAYGFFLGKRVAYLVVANYLYGGFECMLENDSWFICNNLLILMKWHPDVNLLKEYFGTVPLWVKLHGLVTAFSEDGLSAIATKLGTPLMLNSYTSDMCMQSWGRSSYARAMIELRADVELKDNIVAAMPKINRKATILVTFMLSMSENLLDVPVKMGFRPKQVYHPVPKKTTTNTRANKKKNVDPPKEVTNPFEVLTSVKNDKELGTNRGASNLASKATNSSGSSFWNAKSSSPSITPMIEKLNKMENLIIDGKAILVDNEGNPLRMVDEDSEDEVASDDNEIASFLAKKEGYGTPSLLEQLKYSHELDDYARTIR
nr:hypothetical protein [Tanacetum cinerariifolium]